MARYEEQLILDFLKASPKTAYSASEISRKAADRRFFEANPRWAAPLLAHLRHQELIECDDQGHYRYIDPTRREERRRKARNRAGGG